VQVKTGWVHSITSGSKVGCTIAAGSCTSTVVPIGFLETSVE